MIGAIVGTIIVVSCVLVIIRIVLWFIRLIAEAGMIQAVADIDNGIETNFRKAFADGRPFMLNIFMAKRILSICLFVLGGCVAVVAQEADLFEEVQGLLQKTGIEYNHSAARHDATLAMVKSVDRLAELVAHLARVRS